MFSTHIQSEKWLREHCSNYWLLAPLPATVGIALVISLVMLIADNFFKELPALLDYPLMRVFLTTWVIVFTLQIPFMLYNRFRKLNPLEMQWCMEYHWNKEGSYMLQKALKAGPLKYRDVRRAMLVHDRSHYLNKLNDVRRAQQLGR